MIDIPKVIAARIRSYYIWSPLITTVILAVIQILYYSQKDAVVSILDSFYYNPVIVALAALVLIVTLVSYPRVYKVKVLLSGFMLASLFIIFILLRTKIEIPVPFTGTAIRFYESAKNIPDEFRLRFLLLLFNLNLLAIMIMPAKVSYSAGRRLSFLPLVLNIMLYIAVIFVVSGLQYTHIMRNFIIFFNSYVLWLNIALFIAILILSFFRIEEGHNYGSVIVSIAIVVLFAALYPAEKRLMMIDLVIMAIVLLAGIGYHVLESLRHSAQMDPLMKIYNRQHMSAILAGVANIDLGTDYSILIVDIDHFKHINDTHGHQAGDAVLYDVAQIIKTSSLPEGFPCRYGGEEIIIFLKDLVSDKAVAKAEEIRLAIKKEKIAYKEKKIPVTASIGISCNAGRGKSFEKMIKEADGALYEAKRTGRDKVVLGGKRK
ncbi:MAG: GGDEF domain-containing protein [Spirochaetes bacterium]|nr:GGDEF domain-containing protein [Spirochaetota bacterium]